MKKISKLVINPEKLMKNEELITLKGGNYQYFCSFYCDGILVTIIPVDAPSQEAACEAVSYLWPSYTIFCDLAY